MRLEAQQQPLRFNTLHGMSDVNPPNHIIVMNLEIEATTDEVEASAKVRAEAKKEPTQFQQELKRQLKTTDRFLQIED